MRVFLAGATGVIGRRLVPLLLAAGHEVTGMTRSAERAGALRALGAEAAVADALDADAVRAALASARPDAVIHQLTALPRRIDPRKIERDFALNDRLRSEGTRILVDAARGGGRATRHRAEHRVRLRPRPARGRSTARTTRCALDAPKAVPPLGAGARGARAHGARRRRASCCATATSTGPAARSRATARSGRTSRRRRLPIVGGGGGVWSFIHVDDAAAATVAALDAGASGAYNIVDDEPAPGARSGCPRSPRRSARGRRGGCPPGSRGRSPAATASRR